jgi:hypothetical protein
LSGIHLAILVYAGHQLVVALSGLDFVWEPLLQEGGQLLIEVV